MADQTTACRGTAKKFRASNSSTCSTRILREYQAIIAYVVYSQVLKGPQYMKIAEELETHAGRSSNTP